MSFDHQNFYNKVWERINNSSNQSNLDRRWRSRWDFAVNEIAEKSKVIDIACGDGVLGSVLIEGKGCEVHGLDISDYALSIAQSRGLNVSLCNISTDPFPFADELFDFAILTCTLEHILNPLHVICEAHRVLKKRGIALITLPNSVNFQNRLFFLIGRTSKDFVQTTPGECMHFHFYNYKNEFEERILAQVPKFTILKKYGDMKKPQQHSAIVRNAWKFLIKVSPNLFAQYTHWVLRKEG